MASMIDVVIKKGYLTKLPPAGVGKTKKRRYFVLYSDRLEYYVDPQSVLSKDVKGFITIKGIDSVRRAVERRRSVSGNGHEEFRFILIHADRVYELVASSFADMTDWMEQIQNAIHGRSASVSVSSGTVPQAQHTVARRAASAPDGESVGSRAVRAPAPLPAAAVVNEMVVQKPMVSAVNNTVRGGARGSGGTVMRVPSVRSPASFGSNNSAGGGGRGGGGGGGSSRGGGARTGSSRNGNGRRTAPWLFEHADRQAAENALKPYLHMNGTFLLRKSYKMASTFVVSFVWNIEIKNFLVTSSNGFWKINKRVTPAHTLFELVMDLTFDQHQWHFPLKHYIDATTMQLQLLETPRQQPHHTRPAVRSDGVSRAISGNSAVSRQPQHVSSRSPHNTRSGSRGSSSTPEGNGMAGHTPGNRSTPSAATPSHRSTPSVSTPDRMESAELLEEEAEESIGVYECVEDYVVPPGGSKINMKIGHVLEVFKTEHGWSNVFNVNTNEDGWVPSDFLEPIPEVDSTTLRLQEQKAQTVKANSMKKKEDGFRARTATEAGATMASVATADMLQQPTSPDSEPADKPEPSVPDRASRYPKVVLDATGEAESSVVDDQGRRPPKPPAKVFTTVVAGETSTDDPVVVPLRKPPPAVPKRQSAAPPATTAAEHADPLPPRPPPRPLPRKESVSESAGGGGRAAPPLPTGRTLSASGSAGVDATGGDAPPLPPSMQSKRPAPPLPPPSERGVPVSSGPDEDFDEVLDPDYVKPSDAVTRISTVPQYVDIGVANQPVPAPVDVTDAMAADAQYMSMHFGVDYASPLDDDNDDVANDVMGETMDEEDVFDDDIDPAYVAVPTGGRRMTYSQARYLDPEDDGLGGLPPLRGQDSLVSPDDVFVDAANDSEAPPKRFSTYVSHTPRGRHASNTSASVPLESVGESHLQDTQTGDSNPVYPEDEGADVFDSAAISTPSGAPTAASPVPAQRKSLFGLVRKRHKKAPPKTPPEQRKVRERTTRHDGGKIRDMAGADRLLIMFMVKDGVLTQDAAVKHVDLYESGKTDNALPTIQPAAVVAAAEEEHVPLNATEQDCEDLLAELEGEGSFVATQSPADQVIAEMIASNKKSREKSHGT